MKPYRTFNDRDATHPDGKPEPKGKCHAQRRRGKKSSRQEGKKASKDQE